MVLPALRSLAQEGDPLSSLGLPRIRLLPTSDYFGLARASFLNIRANPSQSEVIGTKSEHKKISLSNRKS